MSSVIVVQVGQCGNQLGEQLWAALAAATGRGKTCPSPFFTPSGRARCVLVDGEPKVVEGVMARTRDLFPQDAAACGQSGRGNHWAMGYYGCSPQGTRRDPSKAKVAAFTVSKDQREDDVYLLPKALVALHRETTRCDRGMLEAIVILHSMAGGTGSGFASRLLEKVRLHFTEPATEADRLRAEDAEEADGLSGVYGERRRALYVVSICVAPQRSGENALQGINATLTLTRLQAAADAVIVLRNDDVFQPPLLGPIKPCETFTEANLVFVGMLMPLLQYGGGQRVMGSIIEKLCPDFSTKLVTLVPLPQKTWSRFKNCALLSALFTQPTARTEVLEGVPVAELHTEDTRPLLSAVHHRVSFNKLPVWKAFHAFLSTAIGKLQSDFVSGPGVLALNQRVELVRELLFPLVRDGALKIQARAFLSDFLACGMTDDELVDAYRSVAAFLQPDTPVAVSRR